MGMGENIPEPGKADALLEEGRGSPQSDWRWVSVQLQGGGPHVCRCQGVPAAEPGRSPRPPPPCPSSEGPAHPRARPEQRWGGSRWNVCFGNVPGMLRAAWDWVSCQGGLGRREQPLSLSWKFLLTCHPASGPLALIVGAGFRLTPASILRAEPSQAESPGFVLLNVGELGWAGGGLQAPPLL